MENKPMKIAAGHYEYQGFKIEKLFDYPELDWRIFNSNGDWANTFPTLLACLDWLNPDTISSCPKPANHSNICKEKTMYTFTYYSQSITLNGFPESAAMHRANKVFYNSNHPSGRWEKQDLTNFKWVETEAD